MIELTPVMQRFILRWGEMGTVWGINRTIAQIYALLYLSPRPLTADEISETLSVARSTVSTGLHELQSWKIVKIVHVLGDRRDHFEAMSDVPEMFRAILRQRKSREIDPLLASLRESVTELGTEDAAVKDRLQAMLEFLEAVMTVYNQVEQIPTETLIKVARLGDNFTKVLNKVIKI
ncbi:MAG: MarR family transcriptional regulator [Thermoflexales bacterium]|nr:MarR family transcriptional regulator [Thermoflexales bacterium]